MKHIKINATCKFDVEITTQVTDEVYAQLRDICDNNSGLVNNDATSNEGALIWLSKQINDNNACNMECQINKMIDEHMPKGEDKKMQSKI